MLPTRSFSILLFGVLALAHRHHAGYYVMDKRMLTPDNTCGGAIGYTCGPNFPGGGPCCSLNGYCGKIDAYCGAGCQPAFGICGGAEGPPAPSYSPAPFVSPPPSSPPPSTSTVPSTSTSPSTALSTPVTPPSSGGGSPQPSQAGCVWIVDGAGTFTHQQVFDFSQLTSFPAELAISTDTIAAGPAPFSQLYQEGNVAVSGGTLQLKVPGGQSTSPILGAEIATSDKDILYGSVRTMMQISNVAGTVHSQFFYKGGNQETDIEILTATLGQGVHYTNQPLVPGGQSTTATRPMPEDATTTMHEYRLDWLQGRTDFYLNGVLQQTFTENVPNRAGTWLWNNWSNGDHSWSAGPPEQDNVMKVGKIEMYYNRTGSAGACT